MMGSHMYQYEKILRTPLTGSTQAEGCAALKFDDFTCTIVEVLSEDGASGMVYKAISEDYYPSKDMPAAHLIVKECYPVEIAECLMREEGHLCLSPDADEDDARCFERFLKQFRDAFASHTALYQSAAREQIVVPKGSYSLNGTEYLVSDASNGDTMTQAFQRMNLADQIRAIIRVSEATAAMHEAGYVYLDLKPDNILCIKNSDTSSNKLYTGEIKLFDFDTATKISDLSKADTLISGSGGWSAHEQTHEGYRDKIGPQSDIYAIGSLLFWIAIGRPPKSNEVIHANGKWSISSKDCLNDELKAADERAFQYLRDILNHTLTLDPALRYQSTKPLIDDLNGLRDLVLPVGPTFAADNRAIMAKLDEIKSMVAENNSPKENTVEIKHGPTADELEGGFDPCGSLDSDQVKSDSYRENPAVTGFAVYQVLTMLVNDFDKEYLQDDVRAVLASTATDVKEVLVIKDAAKAENLLEVSYEMVKAAVPLLYCNLALSNADDLCIPVEVVHVCEKTIVSLCSAIIDKDVDKMLCHSAEAELCVKAITPLAIAGIVKKQLGKYISCSYLAEINSMIDKTIAALMDMDAEKLDIMIGDMEKLFEQAPDETIAGMISNSLFG